MTAIMISLVAVVLLILVIGFFAMRYLRADDGEEFEDMPAERGRPRGAGPGGAGQGGASQEWGGGGRVVPMPSRSRAPRQAPPGSFERARERGRSGYPEGRRPGRGPAEPDFAGGDFRGSRGQQARRPDERRPDERRPDARRPDERRPEERRPDERPARRPAASARRGKSDDMSGKDWDSLSDVDYWAELASDKPLTTTAQPAGPAARTERREPERREPERRESERREPERREPERREPERREPEQPDARKARPAAAAASRADESTALLPVRRRPAAGARPEGMPGRYPDPRPRREQPAAPDLGVAALARLGSGARPAPADDDPLTSPSFPAIRSDDSRSYRQAAGRPRAAEPQAAYPAQPYPGSAAHDSSLHDSAIHTGALQADAIQNAGLQNAGLQNGAGQNGYGQPYAAPPVPAGNPYGSYVTPPPARHGDAAAYGYLPAGQETQQYGHAPQQVHAAPVYDGGGQYAAPSHPYGAGQPGGYAVPTGGQYQQPAYSDAAEAGQGQYPEPGYGGEPYGSYPGY